MACHIFPRQFLFALPQSRKRTASDASLESTAPTAKRECFDVGYKTSITAQTVTPARKTKIVVVGKYRDVWLKAEARRLAEEQQRHQQQQKQAEDKDRLNGHILKLWQQRDSARYIPGVARGPFPRYFAKMYLKYLSRLHVREYHKRHIDPDDFVQLTIWCHWQWMKMGRRIGPDGHVLVRVVVKNEQEEDEGAVVLEDIPPCDEQVVVPKVDVDGWG